MKDSVLWCITSCSSLKVDRRTGGTCRLHLQGKKKAKQETSMKLARRLGSVYFLILKIEAIFYSQNSVSFQRTTQRYIPEEDTTLHNYRCKNLRSDKFCKATIKSAFICYSEHGEVISRLINDI
jgi:hypothetical protein